MKAISVKQPWAGNVAIGRKVAEIRSRRIKPQDDIVICASQQPFRDIGRYQCNNSNLWGTYTTEPLYKKTQLYGQAIAVVEWYATIRFAKYLCESACFDPKRWPFGFYCISETETTDEWAWLFKNVRPIKPFLVKGNCGIFQVDDNLIEYL